MTYVREQSSTELAVHMRSLQKMPGWHDPLADRLWQEVEALKAEVAGLRTGYEAYEQVNAELKAEVGALRGLTETAQKGAELLSKDAERYRWLRDSSESIHQFYLSTPIWFTGVKFSKENVDSTIDTAMAQGERS
ncbi:MULTISPECIES: hypothetical protein [unclassified Pseudomonas]|uniref:hypothetical protein n=1 Tax=unclassified Pseudomonas TaxID=196821 RepID=UPI000C87924A|nr:MULTISPECIES: hypothetical protein [unclassified Pseudomonas]PMU87089.1 hypothetical protein C1Y30_23315 [Pseudomonas sp. GW704-F3]PMU91419.1 hypothetical protein C1Y28_23125 [Pseudomonas sp. GW704-F5]PMV01219.1 hypothetical protein C1Y29_20085 [Pseudomonas sp. MPBD4-3]PMV25763.1 hypothetical protein C1Y27_23710 [Pseudomonas sp. GW704-F2]